MVQEYRALPKKIGLGRTCSVSTGTVVFQRGVQRHFRPSASRLNAELRSRQERGVENRRPMFNPEASPTTTRKLMCDTTRFIQQRRRPLKKDLPLLLVETDSPRHREPFRRVPQKGYVQKPQNILQGWHLAVGQNQWHPILG